MQVAHVPVPRSINVATAGLGIALLGLLIQAVSFLGFDDTLTKLIVQNAKDSKKTLKPGDIPHDLHALRFQAWITFGLMAVVIGLLAYSLRRTRSASGSRWALLVALVLTRLPFYIIPAHGLPVPVQIGFLMAGVGSIVAVIFIFFVRQSQQYFRACRAAVNPGNVRGSFWTTGRRNRGFSFSPTTSRPPAPAAAASDAAKSGSATPRARAKVRTDAEAVAKGAELARTRAKASKSRRGE